MSLNRLVDVLKAAAETSRFRILTLLARGDLTVSDLTEILNQSQPRVSRHLKLLLEDGLIQRYQEGSWAFFRLADREGMRDFVLDLVRRIGSEDEQLVRDGERLAAVKGQRQARAADYFARNAPRWDSIRSLHAPDDAVESAILEALGSRPFQSMLDLGTGTGRVLEILGPLYRRGIGIDQSREMLAVARANLDRSGIAHAQVRQADLFSAPAERNSFDLVTMHQVLHYLDEPALAVREAAKFLRPNGRLLIVDFAPHGLEFLRDDHAHARLGFSDLQIAEWFTEAGLLADGARTVEAGGSGPSKLTVKLWIGRDPRTLVAASARPLIEQKETA